MAKRKRRKTRKAKKRTYRRKLAGVGRPRKRVKKRATKRKRAIRGIGYRPSLLKRRGVRGLYPSYMGKTKAMTAKDATVAASLQRIVAPDTLKGVGAAVVGHALGMGAGALAAKYVPGITGNMPTIISSLAGAAIGEVVGAKVMKSAAAGDMAAVACLLGGVRAFIDKPLLNLYTGVAGLYEVNGLAQVRLPEDVAVMGQLHVPEHVDVAGVGYADLPDIVTEEDIIESPAGELW